VGKIACFGRACARSGSQSQRQEANVMLGWLSLFLLPAVF